MCLGVDGRGESGYISCDGKENGNGNQHRSDTLELGKAGSHDYHNDEEPLFVRNKKGVIHSTLDNPMSRDTEDRLQEIGEAYLAGWREQAQKFQDRRTYR